jgi:ribonuclease Z
LPFQVYFEEFIPGKNELIFEDRSVTVSTIPLKHRVPCSGFLFREKPRERHIIREMLDFYQIPSAYINLIKKGEDFTGEDGVIIPNDKLTTAPDKTVSYAYCSDTAYSEKIIPYIEEVDLLYHEATFAGSEAVRAKITQHSTAAQAAAIASKARVKKLIIGHFSARYPDQNILLKEAKSVFEETFLAKDMSETIF